MNISVTVVKEVNIKNLYNELRSCLHEMDCLSEDGFTYADFNPENLSQIYKALSVYADKVYKESVGQ